MSTLEKNIDGFIFSSDKKRIDVDYVHKYLSQQSYWAKDIPLDIVKQSIENSFAVGIYKDDTQIGFARVITDYATFGYLADVFVDEKSRGKGLSKRLMEFILNVEQFKSLRRIILATRDANGLYKQFGFQALKNPDRWMEFHQPFVYQLLS